MEDLFCRTLLTFTYELLVYQAETGLVPGDVHMTVWTDDGEFFAYEEVRSTSLRNTQRTGSSEAGNIRSSFPSPEEPSRFLW